MTYADEEFYKNKYLLGRKPVISTGFPFYAREASYHIDRYTFGRLAAMTDIPTAAVQKQHQIVMKWLENTGLCYQGV